MEHPAEFGNEGQAHNLLGARNHGLLNRTAATSPIVKRTWVDTIQTEMIQTETSHESLLGSQIATPTKCTG
jgi:hypothetical protein